MPERGLDHGEATVGGLLQRWGMRQEGGARGDWIWRREERGEYLQLAYLLGCGSQNDLWVLWECLLDSGAGIMR